MIALAITDIKSFMGLFLKSNLFDEFLLKEATLQTNVSYQIDGTFHPEFYNTEEIETDPALSEKYIHFSEIRPFFFELIRGHHTPLGFSFVLTPDAAHTDDFLSRSSSGLSMTDVGAMFVNFRFSQGRLLCTTGISYQTFSLSHTLDEEWDHAVTIFLSKHGIVTENFS